MITKQAVVRFRIVTFLFSVGLLSLGLSGCLFSSSERREMRQEMRVEDRTDERIDRRDDRQEDRRDDRRDDRHEDRRD